jgi:hypothetical protein
MQPLFRGELLYCEGRPRPFIRGKLHCLCTATAFYYFKVMPWSPVGTPTAVVIYLAHVASSVYHTVPVNRSTEIILQKIDFVGANAYIAVVVFPMALLAFPGPGYVFAGTMGCIAVWNSVDVWRSNYNMARPLLLIATVLPFAPFIASELTTYELTRFIVLVSSVLCGGSLMILYDLFDVYHSFSVVCFVCIMQMNASIVGRHEVPFF